MSKRHEQHDRLLAETFHDDWASGRAAEFARAAAHSARRRRAARYAFGAVATAFAIVGAAWVFAPRHMAPLPAVASPSLQPGATPAYEIISDDELLAHLRDQPLLVVRQPDGSRTITLLPAAEDAAADALE